MSSSSSTFENDPRQSGAEWDDLLAAYEQRAESSAVVGRMAQLRRFARECRKSPQDLRVDDLVYFLTRPGWSDGNRRANRAALAALLGWAHAEGFIVADLLDALPVMSALRPRTSLALVPTQDVELGQSMTLHPARAWAAAAGLPHAQTGELSRETLDAWKAAGQPVVTPAVAEGPWLELMEAHAEELSVRGLREGSIQQRMYYVRRLAKAVELPPEMVTRADLVTFLARGWAPETRRGALSHIRQFFEWAHDAGHISRNPAVKLRGVKVPPGRPHPAPESAIRDAINGARHDVRMMILLASLAGLRRTEIAQLQVGNIIEEGLRVTGKGGRTRIIPMHPSLAAELDAYCRSAGIEAGYLFPGNDDGHLSSSWVGVLVGRRLPPGFSAHSLRHRFASKSYAGQYNIRAVQELLGHSNPAVTARYVAVPETDLVDAVLAVPPVPGIEAIADHRFLNSRERPTTCHPERHPHGTASEGKGKTPASETNAALVEQPVRTNHESGA